jgi:hypothetical protein
MKIFILLILCMFFVSFIFGKLGITVAILVFLITVLTELIVNSFGDKNE